jgi:hypothetical protein
VCFILLAMTLNSRARGSDRRRYMALAGRSMRLPLQSVSFDAASLL